MAPKPILMIGNDLLRKKSEPVVAGQDPIDRHLRDLRDTLHRVQKEKRIGRAIAAPQIGVLKRIIYMEADGERIAMINPRITRKSEATFEVWDSCFSADVAFFGKTLRHRAITVEFRDENMAKVRREFEGDLSELFQHEIDHLEGILFTDRIIDNQIIMRREWEKLGD